MVGEGGCLISPTARSNRSSHMWALAYQQLTPFDIWPLLDCNCVSNHRSATCSLSRSGLSSVDLRDIRPKIALWPDSRPPVLATVDVLFSAAISWSPSLLVRWQPRLQVLFVVQVTEMEEKRGHSWPLQFLGVLQRRKRDVLEQVCIPSPSYGLALSLLRAVFSTVYDSSRPWSISS